MYSNESQGERFPRLMYYYDFEVDCSVPEYPAVGPARTHFALALNFDDIYPEYLPDLGVLICPSNEKITPEQSVNPATGTYDMHRKCIQPDRGWHIADNSYWYFGYLFDNLGDNAKTAPFGELGVLSALCSDAMTEGGLPPLNVQFAAWADVLFAPIPRTPEQFAALIDRDFDLSADGSIDWSARALELGLDSAGNSGTNMLYRLREGVERYQRPDPLTPESQRSGQSTVAVMMDRVSASDEASMHLGGGANVLYLDGHVDFMKFPDGRPVSPDVLWITECVGVAGGTSVPERAKR
jgi:prepilin-type processing-associated H-X9-DG protein